MIFACFNFKMVKTVLKEKVQRSVKIERYIFTPFQH